MKDQAMHKINSTWEELPTIILAEKIKKEKWAVSTTIDLSTDKAAWELNSAPWCDPKITLTVPYKTETMTIYVIWMSVNSKGTVVDKFKIETPNIRTKTSKTFRGAISKIEDTIIALIPSKDEAIKRMEEAKRWKRKMDSKREELKEQLNDVRLAEYYDNSVQYKASASYNMIITFDEKHESLYRISNLNGQFTIDEIRQILKIVGTNPRAVAERLLKQSR